MIRKSVLYPVTAVACGILFVNLYTSIVDAVSWGHDIPASIETTREYFKSGNPGKFFRIFSPANQVLALLALIVCWNAGKKIRMYCGLALLTAVTIDVFTFAYFYPRNDIMFVQSIEGNIEAIHSAWSSWSSMNWVRSGLILVNVILNFSALSLVIKAEK
jgi:carbon starvation protein CstA